MIWKLPTSFYAISRQKIKRRSAVQCPLRLCKAQKFEKRRELFRQGLSESGFSEGHYVKIEHRWANDQYEQSPALASDLVKVLPSSLGTVLNIAQK